MIKIIITTLCYFILSLFLYSHVYLQEYYIFDKKNNTIAFRFRIKSKEDFELHITTQPTNSPSKSLNNSHLIDYKSPNEKPLTRMLLSQIQRDANHE